MNALNPTTILNTNWKYYNLSKNDMKKLLLTIALLFGSLTGNIATAYGQSDSTVIYTDEMDKACIECWTNSPRKDSIIVLLEQFKDYSTSEIYALTDTNDQLMNENVVLNKKVRRNRRIAIGTGLSAVVLGVLLFMK